MSRPVLEFPAQSLYNVHGLIFKLGDIDYDLDVESVREAIEKLADKDFQGQLTVKLHRSTHGTGRLLHIEIHALSIEVEPRYAQFIDFSDTVQVHKLERRNLLSAMRAGLGNL